MRSNGKFAHITQLYCVISVVFFIWEESGEEMNPEKTITRYISSNQTVSVLSEYLVTEEQKRRVLEPVLAMIRAGVFDEPLRKARLNLALSQLKTAACYVYIVLSGC